MSDLGMADRRELAEGVDTELKRGQRETGFDFFDSDGRFTVTTYSPAIVRSLLKHSEARINWIYATGGTDATGRVTNPSRLVGSAASVEGVQATLPKGCLTVKGTVRASNKDSGIVNTPDDAEEAREAFATDGGECLTPSIGDQAVDCDSLGDDELLVLGVEENYVEVAYANEVEDNVDGWRSVEDLLHAAEVGAIAVHSLQTDRVAVVEGGRK